MNSKELEAIKTVLNKLIANIDEMGHREDQIKGQIAVLHKNTVDLANYTHTVRQDLLSLQGQLYQAENVKPEPVTQSVQPSVQPAVASKVSTTQITSPQSEHPPVASPATSHSQSAKSSIPVASAKNNNDNNEGWEIAVGIKWFSRIGIAALLIGFALALNYSFSYMPPLLKISLGVLISGTMFWAGNKVFSQSNILGRILQGGSLSLGYLVLYGAFFFPGVQLFHADIAGWLMLGLYIAGILLLSLRLQSQAIALLSLVFGYYTASFSGYETAALISTTMLGVATFVISTKHTEWKALKKSCLIGMLLTYLYWHVQPNDRNLALFSTDPESLYIWSNFILFHFASLYPRDNEDIALNLMNIGGFYFAYRIIQWDLIPSGQLEMILACIQLGTMAVLNVQKTLGKITLFSEALLVSGIAFIGMATLQALSGNTQVAVLASEALCLGMLSRKESSKVIYRTASGLFWSIAWFVLLAQTLGHLLSPSKDYTLIYSALWVAVSGFALEQLIFNASEKAWRGALLALSSLGFLVTTTSQLDNHWHTVTYVLTGFTLMAPGVILNMRKHRWNGLVWLGLALVHIVLIDIATLDTLYKILVFMLLGAGLLVASYGYVYLEKRLK